jgi:hypothetical protein
MRRPLLWRPVRKELLLLGPVSGDGVRPVDLSRESAGPQAFAHELEASLYQILQILSLTLFEKTPILCALQTIDEDANFAENAN